MVPLVVFRAAGMVLLTLVCMTTLATGSNELHNKVIDVLHIPKTGSQWAVTIANAYCPMAGVKETSNCPADIDWKDTHGLLKCLCLGKFASHCTAHVHQFCGHSPIRSKSNPIIAVFRNATSRIASGLLHYLHDCKRLSKKHKCSPHHPEYPCQILKQLQNLDEDVDFNTTLIPNSTETWGEFILDYGECVHACSANMLTGKACDIQVRSRDALMKKVRAIFEKRIVFAALTEEFNASVDLFRTMFGSPLFQHEWRPESKNSYRGQQRHALEEKIVEFLQKSANAGHFDPVDALVFELAQDWFDKKLAEHKVDQ